MRIYDILLVIAEILAIIISVFWIVYKIKKLDVDDLFINVATYILFIYVATGNLLKQFGEE